MLPLDILFEDEHCLVLNKQPGLPTQAPHGIDSYETRLRAYLQGHDGQKFIGYLGLPHRLDRPVSGAIVFAKHKKAARKISTQFENRKVTKQYWALVAGIVEPAAGTWTDYLRKLPDEPQAEIVSANHPDALRAVLHYRTRRQTPHGAWLEIELETGRMHQIRLQAATHGHAILGDALYGSEFPFGPQWNDARLRAIALHARLLSFAHPISREKITFEAPPPETWRELIENHQPDA